MLRQTDRAILFLAALTLGPAGFGAATAIDAEPMGGTAAVATELRAHMAPSVEPKSGRSPFCSVCTDNRYCCAGVEYCSRSADGRTVICVDAGEVTLIHDEADGTTTVTEIDGRALIGIMIAALCR